MHSDVSNTRNKPISDFPGGGSLTTLATTGQTLPDVSYTQNKVKPGLLDGASLIALTATGEVSHDPRFVLGDASLTASTATIEEPGKPKWGSPNGASLTTRTNTGHVEIAGRHYVTADRLAAILGVTTRTLSRWDVARIGPPKIKIGKLVLFELAKVPDWLTTRETKPVRAAGRRR